MLVKHTRVRGDLECGYTAIESKHCAESADKALHHCEFANIGAVFNHLGLFH